MLIVSTLDPQTSWFFLSDILVLADITRFEHLMQCKTNIRFIRMTDKRMFYTALNIISFIARRMLIYSRISWVLPTPDRGFEVSCPRLLQRKTRRVQNGSDPGAVFTNHSLERSLSYSPEFSMYRSI